MSKKISELSAASALSDADLFEVVQSGSKKATAAQVATHTLSGLSAALAAAGLPQVATVTLTAADLAASYADPHVLVSGQANKVNAQTGVLAVLKLNGGISPQAGGTIAAGWRSYTDTYLDFALLPTAVDLAVPFLYGPFVGRELADVSGADIVFAPGAPMNVPGAIAASAVNDGGAAYVNGDTFTVDTSLGTSASGTITNAVAGVVQAGGYTLDAPNGYLLGTAISTTATSGIGTGLTIDITALDYSVNPITLKIKTAYIVMDVE